MSGEPGARKPFGGRRIGYGTTAAVGAVVTVAAFSAFLGGPSTAPEMWSRAQQLVNGPNRDCGTAGPNTSFTSVWGPARELFTLDESAPFATLNSITDNPNEGDERAFFGVKLADDKQEGGFCSSRRVSDGDRVLLRFYVENSASDILVDESWKGVGLADGVVARIDPDETPSTLYRVRATISSTTSTPKEIYSSVELMSDYPIRLDYVAGSGMLYSNAHPAGIAVDVWRTGGPLGYEQLDGRVPPGYRYALIGTVEARVTRAQ